jgi:hypothetical protein
VVEAGGGFVVADDLQRLGNFFRLAQVGCQRLNLLDLQPQVVALIAQHFFLMHRLHVKNGVFNGLVGRNEVPQQRQQPHGREHGRELQHKTVAKACQPPAPGRREAHFRLWAVTRAASTLTSMGTASPRSSFMAVAIPM